MSGRRVTYVFFFFAVAITAVAAQYAGVSFSDTTVILTCPFETDTVEWWKGKEKLPESTNTLSLLEYTDKKEGLYHCSESPNEKYYFFIKAKVCTGCVDLDMLVAFAVVFADVLVTVGIVLIVYICGKRRAETGAPQRATPRQPRGAARGPTPPDPDYQVLNPATRSNDVYAQAQRR